MGRIKSFHQFKRDLNEGRINSANGVQPKTKEELKRIIKDATESRSQNEVIDLNFIDTSMIEDMSWLFYLSKFNVDISQWNVSNVKDMSRMFTGSTFNGDISQWNVSSVEDMAFMFNESKFNGDISQWDVSRVENMSLMFCRSNFNGDISQWNVSNVKEMSSMFEDSKFNGDISQWNVSNVELMNLMFAGSVFNGDISQWDVSNVKEMSSMFTSSKFNGDISQWDVSNVKYMRYMFANSEFNGDISQWDVSNVKMMDNIFKDSKFTGDISNWAEKPSSYSNSPITAKKNPKKNGPILLGSVSLKAIKLNQQLYDKFKNWSSYWGETKGTNIYMDSINDPEEFEDLNVAIAEADDMVDDGYSDIINSPLYAQFMDEFHRSFKSAGEIGDQWDAYQTAFWEEIENCIA